MKTFSLLIVISLVVFMFSSCEKEEIISALGKDQIEAIKAQMSNAPTPSKEEIYTSLLATDASAGNHPNKAMLRSSGEEEYFLVEIFPLGQETYEVYGDYAIKYLLLYELDDDGYLKKSITLRQFFEVNNGEINTSSYYFQYEIGCSWVRNFRLNCSGNISRITYFFHFDDGRQFAYYGGSDNISLPPISGGKWQLLVNFYDNSLVQTYETELVNYYDESNVINLKLDIQISSNVVCRFEVSKELIQGITSLYLRGTDSSGEYTGMNVPVLWNDSMPEYVSFSAPFIVDVAIAHWTNRWSYWYTRNCEIYIKDGILVYRLG